MGFKANKLFTFYLNKKSSPLIKLNQKIFKLALTFITMLLTKIQHICLHLALTNPFYS